jgi:ATP-binding cassette subfamily B protein
MRIFTVYRRVLAQLADDRRRAWLLAGANILVAGLQFIDPMLFGRVIGLLSGSDRMAPAAVWAQAAGLLGIWAAVGAAGIAANLGTALQAERMAHGARLRAMTQYFTHVLSLPLSFHGEAQTGRLMKTMLSGTEALFTLWLLFFREQCAVYVATLVLLPLTLFLNWRLAISLILLVAVFATLALLVIRHTQDGQRRAQEYHMALAGAAQDALSNVKVVQSFTRLQDEASLFKDIVRQVIAHQFPVLNWWAAVNIMTRACSTLAVISIVVIGTLLHMRGQASVGEIVTFMGLATLLISRLEAAMQFATGLFFYVPTLQDFFGVLDTRSSVPDRADAAPLAAPDGAVTFEHVSFAYPGGPPTLDDVSFTARPGSVIALVGQTGAGKSTAMALLQRLWDPTAGRVTIGGQDLRDVTLTSLRRAVGVVFQESLLFNRSIADNLRIGRPGATQAELEHACRQADAHEFILRQPQGYETMVGERGATLSGGQRQRLAIARALLKDSPILILDEATSALDAATEARVSDAMSVLMRGRTTFIIAHRLSTVREADEILVFDAGRIVERGGFHALLAAGGRFSALVATQLTGSIQAQAAE